MFIGTSRCWTRRAEAGGNQPMARMRKCINRIGKVNLQVNSLQGWLDVALTLFLSGCFPGFNLIVYLWPSLFCIKHFTEEWEVWGSPISFYHSQLKWGPENSSPKSSGLCGNFRIQLEVSVPSLIVCGEDLCRDISHPDINLNVVSTFSVVSRILNTVCIFSDQSSGTPRNSLGLHHLRHKV